MSAIDQWCHRVINVLELLKLFSDIQIELIDINLTELLYIVGNEFLNESVSLK